ncbi:hypothetical protein MXB_4019 [Myxobolus squamalis]|nr:hypothetical protein MXB_4019 [Myxobolus squamalis]
MSPNGYFPLEEQDVKKFLMSGTHCGEKNFNTNMQNFIYSRRTDAHYVIDLKKTWNHLQLAAQILAGIENPKDICAVSGNTTSHRAVLKFSLYTRCNAIAGKFTPGTLTNQSQKKNFREPRIIIVSDPTVDHQVIVEAACMGIPVIAFCNTNCPLNYIDVAIPCNNKGAYSIGVMWWMLTREFLKFGGALGRKESWGIMVDMFFQRDQTLEDKESKPVAPVKTPVAIDDKASEGIAERMYPADPTSYTAYE